MRIAIGAPWVAAGADEGGVRPDALARVLGRAAPRGALDLSNHESSSTTSGAGSSTRSIRTIEPTSSSTHKPHHRRRTSEAAHLGHHARARADSLPARHLTARVAEPDEPARLDRRGDPRLAHQRRARLRQPELAGLIAHLERISADRVRGAREGRLRRKHPLAHVGPGGESGTADTPALLLVHLQDDGGDRRDVLAGLDPHRPHALGAAADPADLLGRDPLHLPGRGDRQQILVLRADERAGELAGLRA